jgi:hypothetical protein
MVFVLEVGCGNTFTGKTERPQQEWRIDDSLKSNDSEEGLIIEHQALE